MSHSFENNNSQKTENIMAKDNKIKGLLVLLLLAVVAMAFYSYNSAKKYDNLERVLLQEKQDLQTNLDEIIEDYNDAIADKTTLSSRLEMELNKIVQLRDSVKNLKVTNYKLIRKYRKRIASLERQNRELFVRVDSLSTLNYALQKENVTVRKELMARDSVNTNLAQTNADLEQTKNELAERVAKGGVLKTSPIAAIAMKERSNGKLTSTGRSSRTDAFRVNFSVLENAVAAPGERPVYIQILDKNNNVVASKGTAKLTDGTEIAYSDVATVNYQNEPLSIVSLVQVNRDNINKGNYTVNSYIDGRKTGSSKVSLR